MFTTLVYLILYRDLLKRFLSYEGSEFMLCAGFIRLEMIYNTSWYILWLKGTGCHGWSLLISIIVTNVSFSTLFMILQKVFYWELFLSAYSRAISFSFSSFPTYENCFTVRKQHCKISDTRYMPNKSFMKKTKIEIVTI